MSARIPFRCSLSLTPGFSPVWVKVATRSRFNGLALAGSGKRLKPFPSFIPDTTRLKPGANAMSAPPATNRGLPAKRF